METCNETICQLYEMVDDYWALLALVIDMRQAQSAYHKTHPLNRKETYKNMLNKERKVDEFIKQLRAKDIIL